MSVYLSNYDMTYFFITPVLGLLRDLSKKKKFDIIKFLRTPFITVLISLYYNIRLKEQIFKVIIFERWLMLFYKTCYSLIYHKPKYSLSYKSSK